MTRHSNMHLLSSLAAITARACEVRDGTDDSGSVTIVIDDEGAARDVRVAGDWRRRLAPARLGEAVVAADGDAATRRATATAQALADSSTEDSFVSSTEDRPSGERPTLQELTAA